MRGPATPSAEPLPGMPARRFGHRSPFARRYSGSLEFTGGIGENAIPVRETVVKSLGYLGIKLDEEANQTRGENKVISTADSKVKVAIVPTNEELAICQETAELVKNQK